MKLVFILNNKSNRLKKLLPGLVAFFEEKFAGQVGYVYTQRKSHASELAKEAAETGCKYLIAVGGDGTLNEVINGVFRSALPSEEYPVVGLLPSGSANDFARTAGLNRSVENLYQLLQSNSFMMIDVGVINIQGAREPHYFINMAGIGLGPEVVQRMARSEPAFGPAWHYFSNIIRGFLRYRKKEVSCFGDAWNWKGRLLQMAVANGRYFGHGICAAPDALLDDGHFQVAIFGDLSIWDYLKNLGKLKKGIKVDHAEVRYFKTTQLRLESGEGCGIEADGEYLGHLHAKIHILPRAISFLAPVAYSNGGEKRL